MSARTPGFLDRDSGRDRDPPTPRLPGQFPFPCLAWCWGGVSIPGCGPRPHHAGRSHPCLRAALLEKKAEAGLQGVALGGELSVPGFVGLHLRGLLQRHSHVWTSSLRIKYSLLGTVPRAGLGGEVGGGRTCSISWGSGFEG